MRSADWLADRFGLDGPAQLEGPVDRGYQGEVWRLTCRTGTFAVKETLAPLSPEQVLTAYALQTRAAAEGVLAPRQLLTADGEPAVYADGETLRVFDWVEMAAPDRQLEPAGVGRMLAGLHFAGGPASGDSDLWFVAPVGRDRWIELVAELQAAKAPFADALAGLVDELTRTESILEPPQDLILCHRDLWADNVRGGLEERPVVIDWDNCGPASPAGELAMVLVEFGTTEERARSLHTAYRRGGPAELTGLRDFTMPAAVLHHLVELGAAQWLAASGELARRRAEGRVREFTDDPFLLDHARRLLATVRRR